MTDAVSDEECQASGGSLSSSMILNAQQQEAVNHGEGPALIIAGAGTGKTRVLAHRAARLLSAGVPSDRILMITFTRKAAGELKDRVREVGETEAGLSWCGTFHATAARLLRLFGHLIDLDPRFSILDESDAASLMGSVLRDAYDRPARKELPGKSTLVRIHSFRQNTRCSLEESVARTAPAYVAVSERIDKVLQDYDARKRQAGVLDYDDLLLNWLRLLQTPESGIGYLFDHVMVDEYQDTNRVQADILYELGACTANVVVVGDDAQAIYSFRGATVSNIMEFEDAFPEVRRLKLERNYRSVQPILDISNALLAEASEGFAKVLHTDRMHGDPPRMIVSGTDWDQADKVTAMIYNRWQMEGVPLEEQAVLFRSSYHAFKFEMAVQRHGIPYRKVGGMRFAEAAHIKDVLAFLRCTCNRADEVAWRRVFELFPGIGPAGASRLFGRIDSAQDVRVAVEKLTLPRRASEWREALVKLLLLLVDGDAAPDLQLAEVVRFYGPLLETLYDNPEERRMDLTQLQDLAGRYRSTRSFLDDILTGDDSLLAGDRLEKESGRLTLSTIHSAKGCEWDYVHIIELVDGGLPASSARDDPRRLEEERRMLYVAMTRARRELVLHYPRWRERFQNGRRGRIACSASPFLSRRVLSCCGPASARSESCELVYDYDDI